MMLVLIALRGNIFLYYGEELGLTQAEIGFADLVDPEAIANWPLTLGRDGARTPMPWAADAPAAGFSTAKPWLPLGDGHARRAVDQQDGDPDSMLAWTRALLAIRRAEPALRTGSADVVTAQGDLLVLHRAAGGQRLECAFNLGGTAIARDAGAATTAIISLAGATPSLLPPFSGYIARCL
jgi:alpha-glucosidase